MFPEMGALPPEAQQAIQQIEQQVQQAMQQLQSTVTVEQVAELLATQKTRPFILDIETDSTVEPDQMAEKQARAEFGEAFGRLLSGIVPALTAAPQMAPILAEGFRYVISGFKVDRKMDEAIDKFAEQMESYQPPPQETGEDPESAKMEAQASMVKAQADAQGSDIAAVLKQDIEDLTALEVTKTPTFFVNGRGLPSFGDQQLLSLVAEEVAKARK